MTRSRNPTDSQIDLLSNVAVDLKSMAEREDKRIWYYVHGNTRRIKTMEPLAAAGVVKLNYADVAGRPALFVHLVI